MAFLPALSGQRPGGERDETGGDGNPHVHGCSVPRESAPVNVELVRRRPAVSFTEGTVVVTWLTQPRESLFSLWVHDGGTLAMSRTSVLVVDDDVAAREMVSLALELAGFDVVSAAGGAEGLEQARRHRPAAIVMDPAVRDVDGIEAARRMRADPELRDIPLIGHSGRSDLDALGLFDAICMKPSPPDALLDRVKGASLPRHRVTTPRWRS
jgi:CheY-like chemotaxis protein